MANITINNLKYFGDKYFYESPDFTAGLNIIEGYNGAGKTTFTNLLYYCLGGSVQEFTSEENKLIEIYNDTNNKVIISITINGKDYLISRYIKSNQIAIQGDKPNEIIDLPVYRQSGEFIFSDWILEKMGIEVFSVYQGANDWKINFMDLMRLVFHDQANFLGEIFKKPDKRSTFINDSPILKKAIFEIHIGHSGVEYYKSFNKLKELEKKRDALKESYKKYFEIAENLRFNNNWEELNLNFLNSKIDELKDSIHKLDIFIQSERPKPKNNQEVYNKIQELKETLILLQEEIYSIEGKRNLIDHEILNINLLEDERVSEITSLEKILYTHDSFNFFHSNTCPICLNDSIHIENNLCICGNEIDQSERNTIFYEKEEYLELLKSRKKSLQTIKEAKITYFNDRMKNEELLKKYYMESDSIKNELNECISKIDDRYDNTSIIESEKRRIELEKELNSLEQQREIEKQLSSMSEQSTEAESIYGTQKSIVTKLLAELEIELNSKITAFNSIYNSFLKETLSECRNAYINNDYYPIINGGSYREASAVVPVRLMYYLTLLKLSLLDDDVQFPHFLIVDTAETAGIDDDNLNRCLFQMGSLNDIDKDYQILMTTGLNKYPEVFKDNVKVSLPKGSHLLSLREVEGTDIKE